MLYIKHWSVRTFNIPVQLNKYKPEVSVSCITCNNHQGAVFNGIWVVPIISQINSRPTPLSSILYFKPLFGQPFLKVPQN